MVENRWNVWSSLLFSWIEKTKYCWCCCTRNALDIELHSTNTWLELKNVATFSKPKPNPQQYVNSVCYCACTQLPSQSHSQRCNCRLPVQLSRLLSLPECRQTNRNAFAFLDASTFFFLLLLLNVANVSAAQRFLCYRCYNEHIGIRVLCVAFVLLPRHSLYNTKYLVQFQYARLHHHTGCLVCVRNVPKQ